ncbi:MAG: tyrosine-type recombinase/integrase [Chloroflexi bacterium]|nr:tyrosine-type recombinase/integrase [Chloroflexota bacterium]
MANLQEKLLGNQRPTFKSEIQVFLTTAGGGQAENTYLTYRSGLAYFMTYLEQSQDWTPESQIAALSPDIVQEFPAWLVKQTYRRSELAAPTPLSESTRTLYLLAVTRFLRFLVLRKRLPLFDYAEYNRIKEELAHATNLKTRPIEQKIPGHEIVEAIIEAVRIPPQVDANAGPAQRHRAMLVWARNLAIILALKSSGLRVSELVSLKRENLDYTHQGAWVTGKGRKTRFVAFDNEAWAAIQSYLEQRQDEALMTPVIKHPLFCRHDRSVRPEARLPVSIRSIQYLIKELAEQANVAHRFNLSPHSLRHYFADGLLTHTGNLALVQEALGHQDPKTTRIYTKIKVEEIAKSVQAMSEKSTPEEKP